MTLIQLSELPYEATALEPVISRETIEFHYGKHHQAYVNNLNNLLPGTLFENSTLDDMVMKAEGGLFNNAAQVWNHTFYWESLTAPHNQGPSGAIADAINQNFGSFDAFKEKFSAAAATLFGSGWAWLVKNGDKLEIVQESNAGNPLRKGLKPLLTLDVWEHAYYIDFRNRRPDYIKAFWTIVNWEAVNKRLA
ncbi:MAG: Superoxide dismutase (Fe) [Bacteroidetes bacterium ADurb.Bin408]|nr:MAG: Superoxide dismutase (Fe) [Bacteroidetes bacterium ADurb.Bin408]